MTDTFTKVEQGAMNKGIDDLQAAHKRLNDTLDALESDLNLSLAKWTGEAQTAYGTAKKNWDASALAMGNVAKKMETLLTDILTKYNRNEGAITQGWQT